MPNRCETTNIRIPFKVEDIQNDLDEANLDESCRY